MSSRQADEEKKARDEEEKALAGGMGSLPPLPAHRRSCPDGAMGLSLRSSAITLFRKAGYLNVAGTRINDQGRGHRALFPGWQEGCSRQVRSDGRIRLEMVRCRRCWAECSFSGGGRSHCHNLPFFRRR